MKKIALVIILLGAHQVFGQQDKSMSMWSQSPMMYNAGSVATGEEDYSFLQTSDISGLLLVISQ